ncbi:unnamed protein product, partial [marine sediment metagenome]
TLEIRIECESLKSKELLRTSTSSVSEMNKPTGQWLKKVFLTMIFPKAFWEREIP